MSANASLYQPVPSSNGRRTQTRIPSGGSVSVTRNVGMDENNTGKSMRLERKKEPSTKRDERTSALLSRKHAALVNLSFPGSSHTASG
jgi:hypothetical protein